MAPPQPSQGVAVAPPGANRCRDCRRDSASPRACRNRRPRLQPGDEVVSEPPAQKIVNKKASFSGLDKITGRIINFDEDIGETVQFGALRVKTDACYTRPATEAANTDAFVEVDEITLQGEVKRIFSGWMYAASPGLHGVEHPIYDIWLTDCKGPGRPPIVSAQPDPPKPGRPPRRRNARRRRSRQCSVPRRRPVSNRRRRPAAAGGLFKFSGSKTARSPDAAASAFARLRAAWCAADPGLLVHLFGSRLREQR